MQTDEEVQRICYQNVLDEADRVMSSHPIGGRCEDCANFRSVKFDAIVPRDLRDEFNSRYGICVESSDEPFPVERDEWHDWEDCWCENRC